MIYRKLDTEYAFSIRLQTVSKPANDDEEHRQTSKKIDISAAVKRGCAASDRTVRNER